VEVPDSAREVLEGDGLAHLVTLDPGGRPQVSIVWVGLDGDEIVAGHLPEHRKIREHPSRAARRPLGRDGEPEPDRADRVARRPRPRADHRGRRGGAAAAAAHTYLGPDVRFPAVDDPPPGHITRITAERIGGVGPWAK